MAITWKKEYKRRLRQKRTYRKNIFYMGEMRRQKMIKIRTNLLISIFPDVNNFNENASKCRWKICLIYYNCLKDRVQMITEYMSKTKRNFTLKLYKISRLAILIFIKTSKSNNKKVKDSKYWANRIRISKINRCSMKRKSWRITRNPTENQISYNKIKIRLSKWRNKNIKYLLLKKNASNQIKMIIIKPKINNRKSSSLTWNSRIMR